MAFALLRHPGVLQASYVGRDSIGEPLRKICPDKPDLVLAKAESLFGGSIDQKRTALANLRERCTGNGGCQSAGMSRALNYRLAA
jgi:hypothetical protein